MEHSRSPMFKCNQTVLLNLDVSKEKKKAFIFSTVEIISLLEYFCLPLSLTW